MIKEPLKETSQDDCLLYSQQSASMGTFITVSITSTAPFLRRALVEMFDLPTPQHVQEYIEWIVTNAVLYISTDSIMLSGLNGDNLAPDTQEVIRVLTRHTGDGIRSALHRVVPSVPPMYFYVYKTEGDFCVIHAMEDIS